MVTLERDRIQGGQILLHTQKTGGTVFLPVPGELQDALDKVPVPRNTGAEARWFFWNGIISKRALIGTAQRTLAAVFAKSKAAIRWLPRFLRAVEVNKMLPISWVFSAAIVRKHYAKWSHARQERISRLFQAVYPGTYVVRDGKQSVIN